MQIELEPSITAEEGGVELVMALIEDHFARGGTLINLNVIDANRVLEAHKDPSKFPDLVVRVTGFSAYFASLSPTFRQLVVDRMLDKSKSGRAPLDLHIHDADYIMYLLGKPEAVKSFAVEDHDSISYISTQYIYDGLAVEAEGGWFSSQYPFSMTFRAIFENAALDYRNDRLMVYPKEGKPVQIKLEEGMKTATGINLASSDGYLNEIRYFTDCIKNNTPPAIITSKDTFDCLDMALKEIESAATGKTIRL
jgi:predicted dehydrogenase